MMAASIEASSGFLNTVLFIFTRHSLVIRPTAPLTGVQITTTRHVADDYSSADHRNNNFNLRSMSGTNNAHNNNKSNLPRDSKGSDEDLQADFEAGNASTADSLSYMDTNRSRTSIPASEGANGTLSELELGREPEAHAKRGMY